jgi:hypothetical protein
MNGAARPPRIDLMVTPLFHAEALSSRIIQFAEYGRLNAANPRLPEDGWPRDGNANTG